jgi:hypothetical protein
MCRTACPALWSVLDGGAVDGPEVTWIGRRHGRRKDRRWAKSWSPEQIANRLRLDFPDDESMHISHEAIYQSLDRLGRRDARALLESVLAARLDESVLERIVAETGGNPLALLELPRGLTPAQLADGFGLPAALPLPTGIEESFRRRLARLPRDARRFAALGRGRATR